MWNMGLEFLITSPKKGSQCSRKEKVLIRFWKTILCRKVDLKIIKVYGTSVRTASEINLYAWGLITRDGGKWSMICLTCKI